MTKLNIVYPPETDLAEDVEHQSKSDTMQNVGIFADHFRGKYMESLEYYRSFYDNMHMVGDRATAERAMYFIPGYNGVPGQARFALPSLTQKYDNKFFLQGCYLPEFSAKKPIWEKYTPENIEKKTDQITQDIEQLAQEFGELTLFASSTGFYDLVRAYPRLDHATVEKLRLYWIACAPDTVKPSPWEPYFMRLNGFEHNEDKWWAYPNSNKLKFLNPEVSLIHHWKHGEQSKQFNKNDLEMRFKTAGLNWAYLSMDNVSMYLDMCTKDHTEPMDIPTTVLAATNDGYWQGKTPEDMRDATKRYVENPRMIFKDTSHLWITSPQYVSEALEDE